MTKVLKFDDLTEELTREYVSDFDWPWPKMNELTHGLRRGEVVTIVGATGLGKSTFVLDTVYKQVESQGIKALILSFEELPGLTFRRLVSKKMQTRIDLPNHGKSTADIMKSRIDGIDTWNEGGFIKWDELEQELQEAIDANKYDIVVIDNMSNLAAGFKSGSKNLAEALGDATMAVKSLAVKNKILAYVVAHVSRGDKAKGDFDKGRELSLSDIRSSEGIAQHSDFVFGIERNALAKDKDLRNYAVLRGLKDRAYGKSRGEEFYFKYSDELDVFEEVEQLQVDIEVQGLIHDLFQKCVVAYEEYLVRKREDPDTRPPDHVMSMSIPLGSYNLYITNTGRPSITFDAPYIHNGKLSFPRFADIAKEHKINLQWKMFPASLSTRRMLLYFDTYKEFEDCLTRLIEVYKTEYLTINTDGMSIKCKLVDSGRSLEITEDIMPGYRSNHDSYSA